MYSESYRKDGKDAKIETVSSENGKFCDRVAQGAVL